MHYLTSTEPIIACSSGSLTNNAVSLLRISGLDDFKLINELFSLDLVKIKPRYAYFCNLVNNEKVIDQVVLTYFKAPNSYNGENILEIGVHGNLLNIERILNLFNERGVRMASPGEFTYRALRNKKLTLSQVEGLDLLLNANSVFGLDQGFSLMSGKLQKNYSDLYATFLNHKSAVELSIDFYEDIGEEQAQAQFNDSFFALKNVVYSLKKHINNENVNLVNPEIALIGLPNAGKSSLFNLILSENRSIVSKIAGTTRDYISERVRIDNAFFSLIDTAGIRVSKDEIETEGIKRSLEIAKNSFYKILIVNPFDINKEYYAQLNEVQFDLIIFSHKDCKNFQIALDNALLELINIFAGPIEPLNVGPMGANKTGPIEPSNVGPMGANKTGPIEPLNVGPMGASQFEVIENEFESKMRYLTADLSSNSDSTISIIEKLIFGKYQTILKSEPVMLERHKELINKIYLMLCDYNTLKDNMDDISIISSELNNIGHCISELIGIISPDDVLHNIFDNFCIGK